MERISFIKLQSLDEISSRLCNFTDFIYLNEVNALIVPKIANKKISA
jgi:hypothetical protein